MDRQSLGCLPNESLFCGLLFFGTGFVLVFIGFILFCCLAVFLFLT